MDGIVVDGVGHALQLIADHCDQVDWRLDEHDKKIEGLQNDISIIKQDVSGFQVAESALQVVASRIENKLDMTADMVDKHTFLIKHLQRKAA